VGTSTIQAYAARWRWHARRAALASHLARARAEGAEAQAQAQGAQMARLAQGHLDAAERALAALELRGAVEEMTAREAREHFKTSIEIARLLRGEVTERVGLDLYAALQSGAVTVEELDALEIIRARLTGEKS
jgi:DNA-binding IclR family transcriptional regulator